MKIPRIIHQTCCDPGCLPAEIVANVEQLKHLNPDWEYRIYGDKDVFQYFASHFDTGTMSSIARVNRKYGVVLADLFRYLVTYHEGGVYLDIKSTARRPLEEVILPEDEYLLSQWSGEKYAGWGSHLELQGIPGGEFQQWHVIAAPRHAFLARVISDVLFNIENYNAESLGVGKIGVMRVSGPICYTLAIAPLLGQHQARLVDAQNLGLSYSIYSEEFFHMRRPDHYSRLLEPIVEPVRSPRRATSGSHPKTEASSSIDSNRITASSPAAGGSSRLDPRRCVILVPFSTHIVPACEQGLIELQRRGYEVWRAGGYSAIDMGRSEMATKALEAGFEETFWIDSDMQFPPDAIDRIRSHSLAVTSGIVARKGVRAICVQTLPGTEKIVVGAGGGLIEVLYAGTGFLHVRREVYAAIQQKLALPLCNAQFGRPMVPFFLPMIVPWVGPSCREGRLPAAAGETSNVQQPVTSPSSLPAEGTYWYLGEDYSFCERARQCGYKIMADTSIRLWHIGSYAYGWEDAGEERIRHDSFLFLLGDGEKR
jgi:hypothetical protein